VVAEKTDLEQVCLDQCLWEFNDVDIPQAQASLSAQNGALFRAHLLQDVGISV
jgi:hypothetical protein